MRGFGTNRRGNIALIFCLLCISVYWFAPTRETDGFRSHQNKETSGIQHQAQPSNAGKIQQRRNSIVQSGTIPFAREFWHEASPDFAEVTHGAASKPVREAIERVTHSFRNTETNVEVSGRGYRSTLSRDGFSFATTSGSSESYGSQANAHFRTQLQRSGTINSSEAGADWTITGNTAQRLIASDSDIIEHLEARENGMFVTWIFPTQPADASEQVIQLEVAGLDYVGSSRLGHHFSSTGAGVSCIKIGNVTAIDSAGAKWPLEAARSDGGLAVHIPENILLAAAYPLAIDPEISPEEGIDSPVPVNAQPPAHLPSIASNGKNYFVVWDQFDVTHTTVHGARITPDGVLMDNGDSDLIDPEQTREEDRPVVGSDGTNFLLVTRRYASQGSRAYLSGMLIDKKRHVLVRKDFIQIAAPYPPSSPYPDIAPDALASDGAGSY
ncbi:MAG: Flagellar hook-length control protein FliK, partial [Verrucomicrobiales bacterium]|nr:Flagellar hook-length control protein FliK [Verrucomicrobiales bacterium]